MIDQVKLISVPLKGRDQAGRICKQFQQQLSLPESLNELREAPTRIW